MNTIKQILAVIDDQHKAEDILKKALELAEQFQAKLIVLHTLHIPFLKMPAYVQDVPVDKQEIKTRIDEKIEALKAGRSLSHYTMVYFGNSTERAIIEAKRDDINLIVAGSEMDLEAIVRKVKKPILVINAPATVYRNIVIPVDLSSKSEESVAFAKSFLGEVSMQLVYGYERIAMVTSMYDISYADMVEYQEENREISENLLKNFEKSVGVKGELVDTTFSLGSRLVEYIDEKKPDLVVVASGSSSEVFNFGSISSYIAKEASKDVLIYC